MDNLWFVVFVPLPVTIQILPYTSETLIPNTFHHSDIFNDSGIHWFPREVLAAVPETLWKDCAEPVYCEDDPEIVTSDVNISVS